MEDPIHFETNYETALNAYKIVYDNLLRFISIVLDISCINQVGIIFHEFSMVANGVDRRFRQLILLISILRPH